VTKVYTVKDLLVFCIENLHTQMYQNLKLTLFFLEDLGGMILIVSTKKKTIRYFLLVEVFV
jgi:hypothetical protein